MFKSARSGSTSKEVEERTGDPPNVLYLCMSSSRVADVFLKELCHEMDIFLKIYNNY
jgi:hypothetical protein